MQKHDAKCLVSIIINNYNYDKFVKNAIDSALEQSYSNIEIIVVDDGSTDSSRQIIKEYKNKIIPVFKQNGGQASAFNEGFKISKGGIICFLDSDDFFAPEKIDHITDIFQEKPTIGWCFHPLKYVDNNSEIICCYPPPPNDSTYDIDFKQTIIQKAQIPAWGSATSGMCFRRSLLEKILPMPKAINISSDYYIRYAAVYLGKGFFLNKPLSTLRVHGNNAWTLQSNKLKQKAKIFVLTGYWLRMNFPELRQLSNKLFSWGLGLSWIEKNSRLEYSELVTLYLSKSSFKEKFVIITRSVYNFCKNKFRQITNTMT